MKYACANRHYIMYAKHHISRIRMFVYSIRHKSRIAIIVQKEKF